MAFNTTRSGKYVDQVSHVLSSIGSEYVAGRPGQKITKVRDLCSLSSHGCTRPFGEPQKSALSETRLRPINPVRR